jgi:hypothetical protein
MSCDRSRVVDRSRAGRSNVRSWIVAARSDPHGMVAIFARLRARNATMRSRGLGTRGGGANLKRCDPAVGSLAGVLAECAEPLGPRSIRQRRTDRERVARAHALLSDLTHYELTHDGAGLPRRAVYFSRAAGMWTARDGENAGHEYRDPRSLRHHHTGAGGCYATYKGEHFFCSSLVNEHERFCGRRRTPCGRASASTLAR